MYVYTHRPVLLLNFAQTSSFWQRVVVAADTQHLSECQVSITLGAQLRWVMLGNLPLSEAHGCFCERGRQTWKGQWIEGEL